MLLAIGRARRTWIWQQHASMRTTMSEALGAIVLPYRLLSILDSNEIIVSTKIGCQMNVDSVDVWRVTIEKI